MHKVFGKYVHITEPLTNNACGQDCALLKRMAQLHTNFHHRVQLNSIIGIVNLEDIAVLRHGSDKLDQGSSPRQSFRDFLYSIWLSDKSLLFLSILLWAEGTVVDCVIPDTAAAETKIVQMNCHLPGYLKFYWKELGHNHDGIVNMINHACDPDLTATIAKLSWNSPTEVETELDLDGVKNEPWMQPISPAPTFQLPPKKSYNHPDHAFSLNSDLLVTTIHTKQAQENQPPRSPLNICPSNAPTTR